MDNITDAISRITDWSKNEQDHLPTVNDHADDDDSSEVAVNAVDIATISDIESVKKEMAALQEKDHLERKNVVFGSWHSTPRATKLGTISRMYNNCGPTPGDH